MAAIKSIEEKAKHYDEVVEKAKNCLKDGTITNTAISYIETIFPELRESEDERIRKELICFLETEIPHCNARDKYIAWLEKQGEQKPQGKLEDDVRRRSTIQVLEYARSLDTYNQYGKADIDKNIAWLKKQGEQKETLCDKCKKTQPSHSCQDIIALGRCALEKQGEQNLTEFERAVKQVMEEAIECGGTHNLKADADMLLSLARNSSWSEEDRKKVNSLCVLLDQMVSSNMLSNKDATEFKDWLKCLKERYTWKPSEEQMITSRQVISGCSYDIEPLVEMEEQLKKLKVE